MTGSEAIAYLETFANYERNTAPTYTSANYNLERVRLLCRRLGSPAESFASVHVAGTKGKGSIAAMLDSILRQTGRRVGLFTSPHLHHFHERIRVEGVCIGDSELSAAVAEVGRAASWVHATYPELGRLTTFELTTAVAFVHFARCGIELAVIETGLGGRLDATNVVTPLVTVLSSISRDHVEWLGATIDLIAREKAGIIKPGVPTVSAPQPPEALAEIRAASSERDAPLTVMGLDVRWQERLTEAGWRVDVSADGWHHEDLPVGLYGRHQALNAAVAVTATETLRTARIGVAAEAIRAGLASVRWPGRFEVVPGEPTIVLDGAHNPESAARLREALGDRFPERPVMLVFGTSRDKDAAGILVALGPVARQLVVARSGHPRSTELAELQAVALELGIVAEAAPTVSAALASAREGARAGDVICVTGSLFVVAEARAALGIESEGW
ncbi:MAG: bifunctional folylpolyglutamate synthase/dihydrofolate synthase [Chloroflexi bacterium]|nr:bifunctional folylpolyglutamate synthase/dihydrofolate synthase [Chloroflexota bacterium]